MFYCWIKYVKPYADKYFSCLNTALLPYLVLSLANCVMSRFDICGDAVRAGLCWSWPLFSANLLFFKGGGSTFLTSLDIFGGVIFSEAYSV